MPEVFYPDWKNKQNGKTPLPAISTSKIDRSLKSIYEKPKQPIRGFKFKYPIQYAIYPDVVRYINQHKDEIKIIFLYRINKLKGAISKQNHGKLQSISAESNLKTNEKNNVGILDLDIEKAIKNIKHRQKEDRKFYNLTKPFPHRLCVNYESLLNDKKQTLKSIYNFLGADPAFVAVERYKKISDDDISLAISNYPALINRVTASPFEAYLNKNV